MAADIINAIADGSGTTYMTTLAEQSISVSMKNGHVTLNDSAKVTTADVLGSNDGGVVVHVIDTVLSFQTIYQLLKANKNFERLIGVVDAAALAKTLSETLSDLSPLTLLAPGNDAFANIPSDLLTNLVLPENLVELRELVENHLCSGQITLEDDRYLEMSSGLTTYLDKDQDKFRVNGTIIDAENKIVGSNGSIYFVDEILNPQTIRQMVAHIDSLNKFYDLVDRLPNNSPANVALGVDNITLLAPVNGAIDKWLNGSEILNLQVEQVETIVKEHIIIGQDSLEKDDFEAFASTNTKVRTLAGNDVTFTKTSAGDLKVNGNKFKNYDIKCKNGIIHITDNALGGFWP
jgi:uncharacterized surface protein with fasciclin (FAS1) repeats